MNLFNKSLLFGEALARGLVKVVDICGKGKDVINQLRRRLERNAGRGRCLVVVPDGAAEDTRRQLAKSVAVWARSFPQDYGILARAWNEGRFAVTDVQGVRSAVLKR